MTRADRPRGITAICLLLGWLSLAGYVNAVVILLEKMLPIPKWFGFFALAYGITASVTTYRLWRMDQSGIAWMRSWAVVVVLTGLATVWIFYELGMGSIGQLLGLAFLTVLILWPLDRYVSRKLSPDTRLASLAE
jgi:uncharacterized membrane protein HdeD (DUF308 family)